MQAMPTIGQLFEQALRHHQSGDLALAENHYRQILQADPRHADAWHLLGVIAEQVGRHDLAVEYIGQALRLKPAFAEAYSNLGVALCEQGKLADAEACYQEALRLKPGNAKAHNNLGNALWGQGKLADAEVSYREALRLEPTYAEAHNNLANALRDQGKLQEAEASCREALRLKPGYAEAHNNLGSVLRGKGKQEEAEANYREALRFRPTYADALSNLGAVLGDQGKLAEGEDCCRKGVLSNPSSAEAHYNLGTVLRAQGKLEEAGANLREALRLKPGFAAAHCNLGLVLEDQDKQEQAEACYREALRLKPDYAGAHYNLGSVLRRRGKLEEAVACYREALRLKPDYAEAHNNCGVALRGQGRLEEAAACYQRALQLKPDYAEALNNHGNVLRDQGKLDEALTCYQRAMQLKPDLVGAHSNLLLTYQYRAGVTLSELATAHAEYGRVHAEPLRSSWAPHANDRDPLRRLRLGFVSGDFGRHPVGSFLIQALENLDQGQCEAVCYYDRIIKDDLASRFQGAATEWWDIGGVSDQVLVEKIRADRIDVLFDLAGHTGNNRLLVFARRPAPVQITWIGYEGTTGLEAIDYILADRYTIPPGQERWYAEGILRMPDSYVCYNPPETAAAVAPLPAVRYGYVHFGSFNNLAKVTPQVVEAWAKILGRVPGSRVMLKYRGLDDERVCRRYLDLFTACGIDPLRIEFAPPSRHADYLASYGEVDIALDPFPFGGGITTCDGLWMGVPAITCPGETFASRHVLSYLSSIGLTEMIARTGEEYVELAVFLAGDLPRLSQLRAGLRERMAASPLCDGKRFAANLLRVVRDAWREWCQKETGRDL
jgi:protein O-GlcNAc transferase